MLGKTKSGYVPCVCVCVCVCVCMYVYIYIRLQTLYVVIKSHQP